MAWSRDALCLGLAALTVGLAAPRGAAAPDARRLEQPDQPWAPWRPIAPAGGAAAGSALGAFQSVQVNVDAMGLNIPGDAANEPSIAVDPTAPNRVVIGWRQFDTIESNFRQAGYAYSSDGGRTWTFPGVLTPGFFRSDPVLDTDSDGTFYYLSLRAGFTCDVFISQDGGVTWDGPMPAFGGDKAWMVIDRSGGQGDGHIHSAWSVFAGCCQSNIFTRSVDGGQNFLTPLPIDGSPRWGTMAVGPDGALYVSGADSSDGSVFRVAKSFNAQDPAQQPAFAFSAMVDLGGAIMFGPAVNPVGLLGQANVGASPDGQTAYLLCSVDPPGSDPGDVMFAAGKGGLEWSAPLRVNDDPAGPPARWQWMAAMSVAPNGRLDAVWNDTRNDLTGATSELYYASSSNGGATWSANVPVSPPFNHALGYPQQNKLGDYYTMVSDNLGAHVAWAATFNGEQDVYHLRIGPYDCNGNGVDDEQDLASRTSPDCNGNGIPDECDIAAGHVSDANRDGVPDECGGVTGDVTGDGFVTVEDLIAVILAWGPCPAPPAECPTDVDGDGVVDVVDLTIVVLNWS
jgi:hypothetical protein